MFEREAALHAAVHHDNVVTVYGSGMDGRRALARDGAASTGAICYRLLRRLSGDSRKLGRRASPSTSRARCCARSSSVHAAPRRSRASRSASSTAT